MVLADREDGETLPTNDARAEKRWRHNRKIIKPFVLCMFFIAVTTVCDSLIDPRLQKACLLSGSLDVVEYTDDSRLMLASTVLHYDSTTTKLYTQPITRDDMRILAARAALHDGDDKVQLLYYGKIDTDSCPFPHGGTSASCRGVVLVDRQQRCDDYGLVLPSDALPSTRQYLTQLMIDMLRTGARLGTVFLLLRMLLFM